MSDSIGKFNSLTRRDVLATGAAAGAMAAGRVMEMAGATSPAAGMALHLLLALPAIALAIAAIRRLSPPPPRPGWWS